MNIKRRLVISFIAYVTLSVTILLGSSLPDDPASVAALRPRLLSLHGGESQKDVLETLGLGNSANLRRSFGCIHRWTYVYSLGPNHELELFFRSSEGFAYARLTTSTCLRNIDEFWPEHSKIYPVTLVTH